MFYFFITSWSFCKRILKFFVQKSPQNATIWCSMENPEKNEILRKANFLKSAVVLGCTEWILEEFKTSLKIFIFFIFSSLLWHFVQEFRILRWKISPKWLNLLCVKTWNIQISNKFNFLKAVIVLGCPNTFLRGFEHFWETLRFFYIFSLLLGYSCKDFPNF